MSKKHTHKSTDALVFFSYPKLFFAWPIIVFGLLFAILPIPLEWVESKGVGWAYLAMMVLVIMTIGVDIERNVAIFWAVVLIAIGLLITLAVVWKVPFLDTVYNYFADMNITYNREFGLALALILLVPFLVMLLYARAQDKWRITHNEFEHYSFGRSDDSLARGAKRVRTTYPDLFEMLLGGAGTLIVYSATGRSELRRIPHVLMLPWKRRQINEILERTAVTTSMHDQAIAEEELSDEMEESAGLEDAHAEDGGGGDEIGDERL